MISEPVDVWLTDDIVEVDGSTSMAVVLQRLKDHESSFLVVGDPSDGPEGLYTCPAADVLASDIPPGQVADIAEYFQASSIDPVPAIEVADIIGDQLRNKDLADLVSGHGLLMHEGHLESVIVDPARTAAGMPHTSIDMLYVEQSSGGGSSLVGDLVSGPGQLRAAMPGGLDVPFTPDGLNAATASVTGLAIRAPSRVGRGDAFSVVASITRADGADPDIGFDAEAGEIISVIAFEEGPLEVVGSNEVSFIVAVDAAQDRAVRIEFRALKPGSASITVDAFRGQGSLGRVVLHLEVDDVNDGVVEPQFTPFDNETEVAKVVPIGGEAPAPAADLAIHVVPGAVGSSELRFFFARRCEPVQHLGVQTLTGDPAKHFGERLQLIDEALDDDGEGDPDELIRAAGLGLCDDVVPESLLDLLWESQDDVTSLIVHTDEPWIPWEMCLLNRRGDDDQVSEAGYLCELFEVTRWRREKPRPPNELSVSLLGYVAPNDAMLKAQKTEVDMLKSLEGPGRSVRKVPATSDAVRSTLEAATLDAFHFIGHGSTGEVGNATLARLELSGGAFLIPDMLRGAARNLGARSPLVFLNACRLGKGSFDLRGIGGWANQFLRCGAGAFIGSQWNVVDHTAGQFAAAFYKSFLGGESLGRAVQVAREEIRSSGDPTWLAYAVYGDPTATVVSIAPTEATDIPAAKSG